MSRYIDAIWAMDRIPYEEVIARTLIANAPHIDIVRCQDCKHWVYNFNGCSRNPCTEPWYATDGCTYGERNDE